MVWPESSHGESGSRRAGGIADLSVVRRPSLQPVCSGQLDLGPSIHIVFLASSSFLNAGDSSNAPSSNFSRLKDSGASSSGKKESSCSCHQNRSPPGTSRPGGRGSSMAAPVSIFKIQMRRDAPSPSVHAIDFRSGAQARRPCGKAGTTMDATLLKRCRSKTPTAALPPEASPNAIIAPSGDKATGQELCTSGIILEKSG